jgi:hypothetical protein
MVVTRPPGRAYCAISRASSLGSTGMAVINRGVARDSNSEGVSGPLTPLPVASALLSAIGLATPNTPVTSRME